LKVKKAGTTRFFRAILIAIMTVENYQNEVPINGGENIERSRIAKKALEEAFSLLNEKQIRILKMRMGIKPYDKRHTLREVGESFDVTPEPIRTQQSLALTRISAHVIEQMREAGYSVPFESLWGNDGVDNLLALIESTQPEL